MVAIQELEVNLKKQLVELTNQIRTAETSLLETKELYLKVSGALEVIELLKAQEPENEGPETDATAVAEALAI
jgi:hypothetical protein